MQNTTNKFKLIVIKKVTGTSKVKSFNKKLKSVGMTFEKGKEQDGMMLAKAKEQDGIPYSRLFSTVFNFRSPTAVRKLNPRKFEPYQKF